MIKKDDLIDAVISGILNANQFYENISNGLWLNDAGVESVLQTKIAESIYNILPKDNKGSVSGASLVMEYKFKEIISSSGSGKKRGRIPALVSGAKRVDLLIFDSNEMPIIPIEVKRNAAVDGFAIDASRILGILKRSDKISGGSVKYGLICGFIFGAGDSENSALQDVERKVHLSREKVEKNLSDQNFEFYYQLSELNSFDDDDWWIGGAVCVYLRR